MAVLEATNMNLMVALEEVRGPSKLVGFILWARKIFCATLHGSQCCMLLAWLKMVTKSYIQLTKIITFSKCQKIKEIRGRAEKWVIILDKRTHFPFKMFSEVHYKYH